MSKSATILHYQAAPVVMSDKALRVSDEQLLKHHIVAHRSDYKESDLFRMLRTQVLKTMSDHGMRTIGITSAHYGDGKTTIALNLALSIALDLKQTVLLADLDLRKPDMMRYMGLNASSGLSDYLTQDKPLSECLVRPSLDRLLLLPAGKALARSSEELGSPKMAELAHEMKHRYPDRIVIYDLPPILAQDDPMVFLPHIDGVLLVVNQGITDTDDLNATLALLQGTHLVGTVLNRASRHT